MLIAVKLGIHLFKKNMSTYASIPYSSQNRGLFCLIPDDTCTFKEGLKAVGI